MVYLHGHWVSSGFLIVLGVLQYRAEVGKKRAYLWWAVGILVFFLWADIVDREAYLSLQLQQALTLPGDASLALELLDEHPFLISSESYEAIDDRRVHTGLYPIHYAAQGGFLEVVRFLVLEGEGSRRTAGGQLPASIALKAPKNGPEMVKVFLDTDPSLLNDRGFISGLATAEASFLPPLLEAGLNPNAEGLQGPLLTEALRYKDRKKVELLLEAGAQVQERDRALAWSGEIYDWLPPDPVLDEQLRSGEKQVFQGEMIMDRFPEVQFRADEISPEQLEWLKSRGLVKEVEPQTDSPGP